MTCYALETDYESGRRFIPVRETDGYLWLHTQYVADSAADALEGARRTDRVELGPEWAAEAPLVGVAEVDLRIIRLIGLAELEPVPVPAGRDTP